MSSPLPATLAVLLAVKGACGLAIGPAHRRPSGVALAVSPCLMCDASPAGSGTLQFSGFRGYFVVLDGGEAEVEVPRERVGSGLVMGDRVVYEGDATSGEPLVISFADAVASLRALAEKARKATP